MKNGILTLAANAVLIVVAISLSWQTDSTFAQTTKGKNAAAEENQLVLAIYESTKTAKNAKDYTELISECERVLSDQMSAKNRNYVTSLNGWALNRRGVLRFETAEQLQKAGNAQFAQAMSKAMTDFDDSIKADARRWRSWMSRGIAYVGKQQFESAIADFTQVIELKPDEVNAWFNRAEANYHAGNYEPAIADYDAVLAMKQNDLQALTGRGHALYADARYSDALADYENVHKLSPNNCEAVINLADAYQMLGRWQEAENSYFSAIKLKPSAIALQRLAWLKATCPDVTYRDGKNAKEMIEKAILIGGESPDNLDTLAAVEAANGNFDIAKQTQEKAIRLAESTSHADSNSNETDYKTRMAMYEEGVPYQQGQKD